MFRDAAAAQRAVADAARAAVSADPDAQFISGGQRGVDQWAAAFARERAIPYHLVLPLPLKRFADGWLEADREFLTGLLAQASTVKIVDPSGGQPALAHDRRNELVVRRGARLIVVWTGLRRGGTFYTLCAARQRGLPVAEILLPAAEPISSGRGL